MIDYSILSLAQGFYSARNYKYIEVPWLVSSEIDDITKPRDIVPYNVVKGEKEKRFIGSGEQGFLYLVSKGHLPFGNFYQTITPCIRNDSFDETHAKYFMKNELIYVDKCYTKMEVQLKKIMDDALAFFSLHVSKDLLTIVKTNEGQDIYYNSVEIGSYGIRSCLMCDWVYGTGVAEPRFSRMISAYQ